MGMDLEKLCRGRILHVMHNDKFNAAYIDLIRKHFDPRDHTFLFYSGYSEEEFKIPEYENIWVLTDPEHLPIVKLFFDAARQVIFHSLFYQEVVCYLSETNADLSKALWMVWGGDMYQDRDLKEDVYFPIKVGFVRKLRGLIHVARQDSAVARDLYGYSGPFYHALYRNPLEREDLDTFAAQRVKPKNTVIQINNSCDESILPILEQLSRFKDQPIQVRVILSYGALQLREEVQEFGTRLFGSRFVALTAYLSPRDYAKCMADTDIAIMNQPRQQGLGNIYAFLYLGTKVYIRKDVTTWEFLKEEGFTVSDTLQLAGESFAGLIGQDLEPKAKNHQEAIRFFDDAHLAASWRKVFDAGCQRPPAKPDA